jgi:hypothetical protein
MKAKTTAPKKSLRPKARPAGLAAKGAVARGNTGAKYNAQDMMLVNKKKKK